MKHRRKSFAELMDENKNEILKDKDVQERIELRLEKKLQEKHLGIIKTFK